MAEDKVVKLVRTLHEKTHSSTITWEKTIEEGVYQASFRGYSVRLSPRENRDALDYILQIYDEDGKLIDEFSDVDVARMGKTSGDHIFGLMKDTYEMARRSAMGVSAAIDSLLKELGVDDDIPF